MEKEEEIIAILEMSGLYDECGCLCFDPDVLKEIAKSIIEQLEKGGNENENNKNRNR